MGKTLADGYLELRLDETKFDPELRAALKKVPFKVHGQKAGAQLGDGLVKGFGDKGSAFAAVAATMAARMTLVGSSAAAAAPGVAQLTAALLPAAGAAAALPAALLAVKAATATVKVAIMGVGDAITTGFTGTAEEAKEALDALPAGARTFAGSILAVKTQLTGLQATIADRFFAPFNDDMGTATRTLIPLGQQVVPNLAGALGGLAEEVVRASVSGRALNGLRALFDNTTGGVDELRAAVGPLTMSFGALLSNTSPILRQLGADFAAVGLRVADFVTRAADTGRIAAALQGGLDTLGVLGGIAQNVGNILNSVFATATGNSGTLLQNIQTLTGQVSALLQSAEGQSALTTLFSTLGILGQALQGSLVAALPALAESIAIAAPAIAELAPSFAALVAAIAPLLPYVTELTVAVVSALTPAIQGLTGWMRDHETAVKAVATAVGVTVLAIKGYELWTKAAAIATTAWTVAQNIAAAASRVWAGVQWALNAAMAANPLGLVVAAVIALIAIIVVAYKNSETFRNVVQAAWEGIQTAVSFAWTNVIQPVVQALVSFFQNQVMPVVRTLYENVFKPAWAGISFAVQAAWVLIQIYLGAMRLYLMNVIIPVIKFLWENVFKPYFGFIASYVKFVWENVLRPTWNAVKAGFSALGDGIKFVWERGIRPALEALGNFVQDKVRPAFEKGVEAVRGAWDKVRDAAKVPVKFVVNSVINPLISGINSAAAFVGVKDRIPLIGGFADGGQIPGAPSRKDNRMAIGPNGLLKVASGEFITNTASTLANLPLLKAINAKKGRVTRGDIDPYFDGRENGGPIGSGVGDFFKRVIDGAKGAAEFVTDPKGALRRLASTLLGQIPAAGQLGALMRGMADKAVGWVGQWLTDKVAGGDTGGIGNGAVLGGWQGMQRLIANRFPGLGLISGYRPGSRTLYGDLDMHSQGRAVDYPPNRALAAWIKATYGARTRELITPWNDLNLWNGKPYHYTGDIFAQHAGTGRFAGNAHVHWAAALGGLIGQKTGLPFGSYDSGGYLPTGLSLAHNGTGRPEPVGHDLGGRTYQITVNVPPTANPAEVGRQIVESIKAYESTSGSRWRTR